MSSTGVSDVSLNAAPDYTTQMAQLQRQQLLAQQLQQQAAEPIQTQSYNGIQAPISPLAVLAKALQGYQAGNLSNKNIKAQSDLSKTDVAQAMAGLNAANIPFSAGSPAALGQSMQYTLPSMPIGGTQVGQVNGQAGIVPSDTPSGSTTPIQYTLDTPDLPSTPSSYQQQMAAAAPLLGGGPVSKSVGEQIFTKAASDQETQQTLQRQMASMAPIIATMPSDQQAIVTNMAAVNPAKALDFITTYQQEKAKAPVILTAQQAAAYGLPALTKPGSYYQGNPLDGFKPVETGDLASPARVQQEKDIAAAGAANSGWTIALDPSTQIPYRYNTKTAQATTMSGQPMIAPDGFSKPSAMAPRTPMAIYMQQWEAENPKATAAQRATAMNVFTGQQSEQHRLGTLGATVESSTAGLDTVIGQAQQAYQQLPRGQFVPFNKLAELSQTNAFSSPQQAQAFAADTAVINMWAKSINPTGTLTVENARRGAEMLSQAQSPEAHAAVLQQMLREGAASRGGINAYRNIGPSQSTTNAPTTSTPATSGWSNFQVHP